MDQHDDMLNKTEELMKKAFAFYRQGDYEQGDACRQEANQLYDQITSETNRNFMNMTATLYGEGRNFGIISHVILENAARYCSDDKMCKKVGKICRYIKSNKLLTEQFAYYHSLCETKCVKRHADLFVEQVVNSHDFNRADVLSENNKLIAMMRENGLDEMIDIDAEQEKLYESAEFLMYNHDAKHFDEIVEHKARLAENIKEQGEDAEEEEACANNLESRADEYDNAVSLLTPTEQEMFNILIGDDEELKKAKYEELKQQTIERLNSAMADTEDEDCKSEYQSLINQVENMTYSNGATDGVDNCLRDICKFMGIVEVVESDDNECDEDSE